MSSRKLLPYMIPINNLHNGFPLLSIDDLTKLDTLQSIHQISLNDEYVRNWNELWESNFNQK